MIAVARNMAKSDKQKGAYCRWVRGELGKVARIPMSPVATRWNSNSDAINTYLDLHADLKKYAASPAAVAEGAGVIQENVLSDREVAKLEAVQPVMAVVKEACLWLERPNACTGV